MVLIVLVNQVFDYRKSLPGSWSASISDSDYSTRLPNSEVVVVVVDDGGNATVRVYLHILRTLLFPLAEVEVHRLVRQPKFLKNNGDFPESQISFQIVGKSRREADSSSPSVRASSVGVQSKLLAVRHCRVVGRFFRWDGRCWLFHLLHPVSFYTILHRLQRSVNICKTS